MKPVSISFKDFLCIFTARMECSICLESLDTKCTFTLSCNHKLHYDCFLRCSYQKSHIFIDCPLCRDMNINTKPAHEDPSENIKSLLFHKSKRCSHKTKKGSRCKRPISIMNYDQCSVHNRDVLPQDKYDVMNRYMIYMLQVESTWFTKICMIDFVKKILIKFPETNTVDEIHTYGLRYKYYLKKNNDDDNDVIDTRGIYEYYDLAEPDPEWVNRCRDKKTLA